MEVEGGGEASGDPSGASDAEAAPRRAAAAPESAGAVRTEPFSRKVSWTIEFLDDVGGANVARVLALDEVLDANVLKGDVPDDECDGIINDDNERAAAGRVEAEAFDAGHETDVMAMTDTLRNDVAAAVNKFEVDSVVAADELEERRCHDESTGEPSTSAGHRFEDVAEDDDFQPDLVASRKRKWGKSYEQLSSAIAGLRPEGDDPAADEVAGVVQPGQNTSVSFGQQFRSPAVADVVIRSSHSPVCLVPGTAGQQVWAQLLLLLLLPLLPLLLPLPLLLLPPTTTITTTYYYAGVGMQCRKLGDAPAEAGGRIIASRRKGRRDQPCSRPSC